MPAFRWLGWGVAPGLAEAEVPTAGPGEVLVRVGGAGICRSDLVLAEATPGSLPAGIAPPFTTGHEIAGWVEEVGPGVTAVAPGTPVVCDHHVCCGVCPRCRHGQDQLCERGGFSRGFGVDGGMAPYVVVPATQVVPLGRLHPTEAAPLACAGRTAYHAVHRVSRVLSPGSTAVVIGAGGGLGRYGVQILRATTAARVVAVDTSAERLAEVAGPGVELVPSAGTSTEGLVARLQEATGGGGAEAVLDFVGTDDTLRAAAGAAQPFGALAIVGAGGGSLDVGWGSVPGECEVFVSRGGSLADLHDVVTLAESGAVSSTVEVFPFDRVTDAHDRLRDGRLAARAVVAPSL